MTSERYGRVTAYPPTSERRPGSARSCDRRVGLAFTRLRHPRVTFGPRCDVRSGARFAVTRDADVRFGAGCVLDYGFTLESMGRLVVGDRTVFGPPLHGRRRAQRRHRRRLPPRRVGVGPGPRPRLRPVRIEILYQGRSTAPVLIGDDVWVGAKATITRG